MGGKNAALVWENADLETALFGAVVGAFASAGQRSNSTSRVIVQQKDLEEFVNRFHEQAKRFSIGNPLDNPFMGPLIDSSSVDRYMKFLGIAAREGCEWIMRGKSLELNPAGYYVTPSICLATKTDLGHIKKSVYHQTEFFAPNVLIMGADNLDQAIQLMNSTQYGLVSSVFTPDRKVFDYCLRGLDTGLIHWNQPTIAYAGRLPVCGRKKSGSVFPSGIAGSAYSAPVSSVETAVPVLSYDEFPGLNWSTRQS